MSRVVKPFCRGRPAATTEEHPPAPARPSPGKALVAQISPSCIVAHLQPHAASPLQTPTPPPSPARQPPKQHDASGQQRPRPPAARNAEAQGNSGALGEEEVPRRHLPWGEHGFADGPSDAGEGGRGPLGVAAARVPPCRQRVATRGRLSKPFLFCIVPYCCLSPKILSSTGCIAPYCCLSYIYVLYRMVIMVNL
jgi:hypothetical protein